VRRLNTEGDQITPEERTQIEKKIGEDKAKMNALIHE